MKQKVKYNKVTKQTVDLHPQVAVSEASDRMSSKASVRISIPAKVGDLEGVLDQVRNGFGRDVQQRLDSFDKLGASIDGLREHEVEADPEHPFCDQSFRDEASSHLKEIEAILGGLDLPNEMLLQIKDVVVTRAFRAGMLVSELASRQEHLKCVATDGHRSEAFQERNRFKKGDMTDANRAGVARMDELMAEGHKKFSASIVAASEGFGQSDDALRSAFRRREKRRQVEKSQAKSPNMNESNAND